MGVGVGVGWRLSNLFNPKEEQGIDFSSALVDEEDEAAHSQLFMQHAASPRSYTVLACQCGVSSWERVVTASI